MSKFLWSTNRKILFRLTAKGKAFYIYKGDIPLLLVTLLLTIISIWFLFKDFNKHLKWSWFFPAIFIAQVLKIFFRPTPKYKVEITSEMLNAIEKETGPFQYDLDGFIVSTKNEEKLKVKWKEINRIIAYRNEYFAIDEIGLNVYADNKIQFSVPELSPGCIIFYKKVKENLQLTDEQWFGNITVGNRRQIIFQRLT